MNWCAPRARSTSRRSTAYYPTYTRLRTALTKVRRSRVGALGRTMLGSSSWFWRSMLMIRIRGDQRDRLLNDAAEAGPPIGSCWAYNRRHGRRRRKRPSTERRRSGALPQRDPRTNQAARTRRLGQAPVFDAPGIHDDEVIRLPDGATLLASNAHSEIQAAGVIPLGRSEVWACRSPSSTLGNLSNSTRHTPTTWSRRVSLPIWRSWSPIATSSARWSDPGRDVLDSHGNSAWMRTRQRPHPPRRNSGVDRSESSGLNRPRCASASRLSS